MRVITAPEKYIRQPNDITVFLAGGITNCWEWQDKVIELLNEKKLDNLVIFNPRRKDFSINNTNAAEKQIMWEFKMLEQCDIFSMYFCAGESDQPICMYELGRNICRMQMRFPNPNDWPDRIIITTEDGYKRKHNVYMQTALATNIVYTIYKDIEDHTNQIIDSYKKLKNY